jgi:hypothetical protein
MFQIKVAYLNEVYILCNIPIFNMMSCKVQDVRVRHINQSKIYWKLSLQSPVQNFAEIHSAVSEVMHVDRQPQPPYCTITSCAFYKVK